MDAIFNFFGSILGYILWFFYYIVGNYGVAIILFTIFIMICQNISNTNDLKNSKREMQS